MTPQALAAHLTRHADITDVPVAKSVAAELRKPSGQDWAARRAECAAAVDATTIVAEQTKEETRREACRQQGRPENDYSINWRSADMPAALLDRRQKALEAQQLAWAAQAACDVADPPAVLEGEPAPDHLERCLNHLAARAYGIKAGGSARRDAEKANLDKDKALHSDLKAPETPEAPLSTIAKSTTKSRKRIVRH